MGFFDELGKKVTDMGQKTLQKTKDLSDTMKIRGMISDAEKRVESLYVEVGKLYVSRHSSDPEPGFEGFITNIAETEAKIKELTKQVQDLRGVQVCKNCGAEIPAGVGFCSACGTKIPEAQAAPVASTGKVCSNCGKPIKEGVMFCTECGTPVQAAEPVGSA
ncbi:MAG: zinc ribbon domain-containing protein, partial [Firmicutes bacterium]|nr:zinc ribbon domain-containing protein [Bacillota bacterium]